MDKARWWIASLVLMVSGIGASACSKTFRGSAAQPNPLAAPTETLRVSEKVVIVTGDMELMMPTPLAQIDMDSSLPTSQRYPLHNEASFMVVSRDRLRFHVQIEHKWREYADIASWNARLVDDRGRTYQPELIERVDAQHLVNMWDYERRSVVRDHFRDIVHVRDDGHRRRQPLGSLSVFRGQGDFVFYSRDIFSPDIKRMSLVLERGATVFVFTWKFADEAGTGEVASGWDADIAAVPEAPSVRAAAVRTAGP